MKTQQFRKITYLGQKAEITKIETDLFDRTWINLVYWNISNGSRTAVSKILITDSAIKFI